MRAYEGSLTKYIQSSLGDREDIFNDALRPPDRAFLQDWPFMDLPGSTSDSNEPMNNRDQVYARAQRSLIPEILNEWTWAFQHKSNFCSLVAGSVIQELLQSYTRALTWIISFGADKQKNIISGKHYLKVENNDTEGIMSIRVSEEAAQSLKMMMEKFIDMMMDKDDMWEDLVRRNWNTSIPWAIDLLENKYGPDHMDKMDEKTWAFALNHVICKGNFHQFTYQLTTYRQEIIKAIIDLADFPHKSVDDMENILGLDRLPYGSNAGYKLIPERSGYLTIFSGVLYQQVRKVIAGKEFFTSFKQDWPTAVLDTSRGTIKGVAQIRPDFSDQIYELSRPEMEEYQDRMRQLSIEMDDETVDVLDIICHAWLKTARHSEAFVAITADDLLRLRGLMEQKGGKGGRGGYKDEWRKRMAKQVHILRNTWIKAEHDVVKEVDTSNGIRRQMVREFVAGSLIVISSISGNANQEGASGSYTWYVRPGDFFAQCLLGPGRQTALLSQKALKFDPYRQALEKRATRYFAWQWRNRQNKLLYMEPIRVRTIMEGIHMPLNASRPSKTVERFEKMMDALHSQNIINGWQYSETYSKWQEWVELKVVIEPPQEVVDHYLRIKSNPKHIKLGNEQIPSGPGREFDPQVLKLERQKRKLSQMQAAEQIGIRQTTFSRLESGKMAPNAKLLPAIKHWLTAPF